MKKFLNLMSLFTLLICTVLTFHGLYLTYYPFQVIELKKFETEKRIIKRGKEMPYTLEFIKYHDFKANIKYFLVDGIILRLEDGGTHREPGKSSIKNGKIIPTTIIPGIYRFRIELDYEIAPWRHILYSWESNEFRVE